VWGEGLEVLHVYPGQPTNEVEKKDSQETQDESSLHAAGLPDPDDIDGEERKTDPNSDEVLVEIDAQSDERSNEEQLVSALQGQRKPRDLPVDRADCWSHAPGDVEIGSSGSRHGRGEFGLAQHTS